MRRGGIFLFFDPQGKVDDYILKCLGTLREYIDEILVVTYAHDPALRRRSYELLAQAWNA